jgi:neurocalcin delta
MGKQSSKLKPETLADLKTQTKFSDTELLEWYKGFLFECPKGELSIEEFRNIYRGLFPNGNGEKFAEHVFRAFDENRDGTLDFREFMCALSVSSRGTAETKAKLAFKIYDLDRDGYISQIEMMEILRVRKKIILFTMTTIFHLFVDGMPLSKFTCMVNIEIFFVLQGVCVTKNLDICTGDKSVWMWNIPYHKCL